MQNVGTYKREMKAHMVARPWMKATPKAIPITEQPATGNTAFKTFLNIFKL